MKTLFAALGALLLALVAWLMLRPAAGPELPTLPPAQSAAAPTPSAARPPTPGQPAPDLNDIPLDEDAIASLRGAREFGDPRTPPIGRSAPREEPTPEELADPEKYAAYEARQERKVKRAYVVEAEKYVAQLRSDIERGRAMGIPPEEIAKVERKAQLIEQMRARLLEQDPQILDPNSPLPPPAPRPTDKIAAHE